MNPPIYEVEIDGEVVFRIYEDAYEYIDTLEEVYELIPGALPEV